MYFALDMLHFENKKNSFLVYNRYQDITAPLIHESTQTRIMTSENHKYLQEAIDKIDFDYAEFVKKLD